jgi:hypothetical protein
VASITSPSFTVDAQLEAELPSAYQGVTLQKFSFSGTDLSTNQGQSQGIKDVLALVASLGKTPADLSFAAASDPTGKVGLTFSGYRIKGADASSWAGAFYQLAQKAAPGTTVSDAHLGGKAVTRIVTPLAEGTVTYAWPDGDVLFLVHAANDAQAGPAIAVMP